MARLARRYFLMKSTKARSDAGKSRWLSDADPGSRAREVTLIGDGQEIANVTQLHRHLQKISYLGKASETG